MAKFSQAIRVVTHGGSNEIVFVSTEDIRRWLDVERVFWKDAENINVQQNFRAYWTAQKSFFEKIASSLKQYEDQLSASPGIVEKNRMELEKSFERISNGTIITSESPHYPEIVNFSNLSPEISSLLLLAGRSDAASMLANASVVANMMPALVKFVLFYGRKDDARDWLAPQRKDLVDMRSEYASALSIMKAECDLLKSENTQRVNAEVTAVQSRSDEWRAQREKFEQDWGSLKKVYDEQLALLAPTQYWKDRAIKHGKSALLFSGAFAACVIALVSIFMIYAAPHLAEVAGQKDVSPILVLIPVAVPAFAGVWVLKILSRLLSESLQLMRDAWERETMVKTFLALMRDDQHGRELVRSEDRILILHSLFRPSSVNAADDAPPVHWFDILSNKVAGKTSGK